MRSLISVKGAGDIIQLVKLKCKREVPNTSALFSISHSRPVSLEGNSEDSSKPRTPRVNKDMPPIKPKTSRLSIV